MEKNRKVGIVCCSNGQKADNKAALEQLEHSLKDMGITPVFSDHIYARDGIASGSGEERAQDLMAFYRNPEVEAIFDVSGGDLANEILPYLDYSVIAGERKKVWGYSDLTTVINAIYSQTGKASVLYQIRNLVSDHYQVQCRDFNNMMYHISDELFRVEWKWVQGEEMRGVLVGGNIRCFLKLAGTCYFPSLKDKLLLLESLGGDEGKMITYLCQLKQLGAFEQLRGVLLGTFTQMQKNQSSPCIEELVQEYVGDKIPIVKTEQIGHGTDSKAIVIGKEYHIRKDGGYTC